MKLKTLLNIYLKEEDVEKLKYLGGKLNTENLSQIMRTALQMAYEVYKQAEGAQEGETT